MPGTLPRNIFSCRCGHSFHSDATTRAKCPKCGSRTRTHVPATPVTVDPRQTLDDCQRSLSTIASRARDGTATDVDVAMARIFADAMKYLTPALEASLVEKRDTKRELIEMLENMGDDDSPPALPEP